MKTRFTSYAFAFLLSLFIMDSAIGKTKKQNPSSTSIGDSTVKVVSSDSDPDLKRFEFGIRYLPTFSGLDLKSYNGETVKGSFTVSQAFGVMFAYNASPMIGFQTAIDYFQSSQTYKGTSSDRTIDMTYINIPVLLTLNSGKKQKVNVNLVAGPQFGFNVGSKLSSSTATGSDTVQAVVAVKKVDFGFAYGAGLELALNKAHTLRFDAGYRGFYGLVNMDGSSEGKGTYNIILKTTRQTHSIYVGFAAMF